MKGLKLLKVLCSVLVLTFTAQVAKAQIKFGDNPGNINGKAVLELESTDKGLLIPRMTTLQRTGLGAGATEDGIMVYDTDVNCTFVFRADSSATTAGGWQSLCAENAIQASNGVTKLGRDIQLGGTLVKPTTVATGGSNTLSVTGDSTDAAKGPLRLTGVQTAYNPLTNSMNDSILTINAQSGYIRKVRVADFFASNNLDSFVWKLDGNNVPSMKTIGTKNNFALPFITNNVERMRLDANGNLGIGTTSPTNRLTVEATADPLKVVGLQTAAMTDSLMTIDMVTGVVRKITIDSVASRGVVAENGLTKTGNVVRLGGTLNRETTIAQASNNMAFTGTGNVGVGTTAATTHSKLHLGGSIALPIRAVSSANTVTYDDYTIITDATTAPFTLTLPAANTCAGRTYVIIKSDLTTNALTFDPALKLGNGGTAASNSLPSINYNSRIHIQSDGTNWWLLARF
jgi:hypothetical protein